MKKFFTRMVVLILLITGVAFGEAHAQSNAESKCTGYGELKPNVNPSFQQLNCLLTNAAIEANIPPEVVKAVATQENSGWKQFDENGKGIVSADGGIGLMQLTNQSNYDQEKLKNDIIYNINAGIEVLNSMYERTDLPKIKGADRQVIENWYFPVMAYNGTKPVNSPIVKETGLKNEKAYQEKVFLKMKSDSYLGHLELAKFPFSSSDFQYDPTKTDNIVFLKKEYTVTGQTHKSAYSLKSGKKVVVTGDLVNVRINPGTTQEAIKIAENTNLVITGNFVYDPNKDSKNQFVWFPVETVDQKTKGYISSAYISEVSGASETEPKPTNSASKFADYRTGQYWSESMIWAIDKGIMQGFTGVKNAKTGKLETLLKPGTNLTEAQFLAVLFRYAKPDELSATKTVSSWWASTSYQLAEKYKIPTLATAKNSGKSTTIMTRGKVAVAMATLHHGRVMSEKDAVQFMYDADIANGYTAGAKIYANFGTTKALTRGHIVTFLKNYDNYLNR